MQNLLILFAKAPERGYVKTRLVPFLSEENACTLQKALILDTLYQTESPQWNTVLACAPTPEHPFFIECSQRQPVRLIKQEGTDLGERMKNALYWGLGSSYQKVVIIGCDTPTLPVAFLCDAFVALDHHQAVIGPSTDGGYYLIGATSVNTNLFANMAWGTDHVFQKTVEQLKADQWSYHLLPPWYDIDRPEDMTRLKEQLNLMRKEGIVLPIQTNQFLQSIELPLHLPY
jgi:rSAM/selenodomain-associated transferase 1